MIKYIDNNGKTTGWLSEKLKRYELKRLTIDQLLIIAKRKKGLKNILIEFTTKEIINKSNK
jgi:hypothetical protein